MTGWQRSTTRSMSFAITAILASLMHVASSHAAPGEPTAPIVLKAAHMLDVRAGVTRGPAEILVRDNKIVEVGSTVSRPADAVIVDLGDRTLMPGLIDAHAHLFLHPGAMDMQTIKENVSARVIGAVEAAKRDLAAGFTAERDMGTEGAGSASSALRDAIDARTIIGPRLRVCGNAISILGGHEDAIGYNSDQHLFGNADQANTADALVEVIRRQRKEGADFTKVYETGPISVRDGRFVTPVQYTLPQLSAAVAEADRQSYGAAGQRLVVHAETEPGTGIAAQAGVASIDHAYILSDSTMALMKARRIFAVPTLAIFDYYLRTAETEERKHLIEGALELRRREFKRQIAAGVPFAVGSDVGPFPHGTQAKELEMMVDFGMPAADVLRADLLNGAELLGWAGQIGELKPGMLADIIAVDGDPLQDITATSRVTFVMKDGTVFKGT